MHRLPAQSGGYPGDRLFERAAREAAWTARYLSSMADIGQRGERPNRGLPRAARIVGISDRPRIHHGYSETLEVAEVARGKRCPPSGNDAGDLDIPDLDAPTSTLPARGDSAGSNGSPLVERLHPAFQLLLEKLVEGLLQFSSSLAGVEEPETRSDLEDGDSGHPYGLRRLIVEPGDDSRVRSPLHQG